MKKMASVLLTFTLVFSLCACGETEGVISEEKEDVNVSTSESVDSTKEVLGEPSEENASLDLDSATTSISEDVLKLREEYASVATDELTWDYNSSTKTLIISGIGPMRDYSNEAPEWDAYSGEAENLIIEDEVTSIGNFAFWGFTSLTNVKLGASLEYIGDFAFQYCTNLWTMNFPDALKYVGEYSFANALLHSENGFAFPEGMLYLGEDAFYSAFKESFVSIPASLSYIGKDAFANIYIKEFRVDENNPSYKADNGILYDKDMCTLLYYPALKSDKVFEVPSSVTNINAQAIQVTNDLEKIVIHSGVEKIDEESIFWNYGLSAIEVDEENGYYMSVNGVLFTKDGKNLICYPGNKPETEYSLPDGCERICNLAMSSVANLSEVHYNDTLTEIGYRSFAYCNALSKIGLAKTLNTIDSEAFLDCNSLSEIYFAGTPEEWGRITIGEGNEAVTGFAVLKYVE